MRTLAKKDTGKKKARQPRSRPRRPRRSRPAAATRCGRPRRRPSRRPPARRASRASARSSSPTSWCSAAGRFRETLEELRPVGRRRGRCALRERVQALEARVEQLEAARAAPRRRATPAKRPPASAAAPRPERRGSRGRPARPHHRRGERLRRAGSPHRLAADAGVERVVGVDTRPVDPALAERIDVVAADLRSAELPAAGTRGRGRHRGPQRHRPVPRAGPPARVAARRQRHRHAAAADRLRRRWRPCAPSSCAARRRSTAPSRPRRPSSPRTTPTASRCAPASSATSASSNDLVGAFARRHPAVTCTVLRLQPVVGRGLDTPVNRLLRAAGRPDGPRLSTRACSCSTPTTPSAPCAGPCCTRCAGRSTSPPTASSRSRAPLRHARRPALPIAAPLWGRWSARRAARPGSPRCPTRSGATCASGAASTPRACAASWASGPSTRRSRRSSAQRERA